MTVLPTAADIDAAARAIDGAIVRTPLVRSPALSQMLRRDVLIKAELLQRGGSFKLRGVLNRVRAMSDGERRRGVATVSAGNHAKAVAIVCAAEGIDATVFMPRGASTAKVDAVRAAGATADLESEDAAAAFARLAAFVERSGASVLHPYDDLRVVAGQGTVGAELIADCPDASTVVVPVGGGGLVSGIAIAVKERAPGARIVAVEPERAATLTAALAAGEPVQVDHQPTLADALAPPAVGEIAFAVCSELVDEVITLTEPELRTGLQITYTDAKLACEVGGAAAVAALSAGHLDVGDDDGPVVVVVSGGNIAPADLRARLADAP
jgi:threonine dehydratase